MAKESADTINEPIDINLVKLSRDMDGVEVRFRGNETRWEKNIKDIPDGRIATAPDNMQGMTKFVFAELIRMAYEETFEKVKDREKLETQIDDAAEASYQEAPVEPTE